MCGSLFSYRLCYYKTWSRLQVNRFREHFLYFSGPLFQKILQIWVDLEYDVFAMLPAISAGNALAAQNLEAGKPERARKFLKYAAVAAFGCSLLFFAWAQLTPESMIGIFSADPQVIQAGIPFFRSCSLDYLAVALLFSGNDRRDPSLPHLAGKKEKKPRFLCFVAPVIHKDKGQ